MIAHCRTVLAGYKCPKEVELRDQLPAHGHRQAAEVPAPGPLLGGPGPPGQLTADDGPVGPSELPARSQAPAPSWSASRRSGGPSTPGTPASGRGRCPGPPPAASWGARRPCVGPRPVERAGRGTVQEEDRHVDCVEPGTVAPGRAMTQTGNGPMQGRRGRRPAGPRPAVRATWASTTSARDPGWVDARGIEHPAHGRSAVVRLRRTVRYRSPTPGPSTGRSWRAPGGGPSRPGRWEAPGRSGSARPPGQGRSRRTVSAATRPPRELPIRITGRSATPASEPGQQVDMSVDVRAPARPSVSPVADQVDGHQPAAGDQVGRRGGPVEMGATESVDAHHDRRAGGAAIVDVVDRAVEVHGPGNGGTPARVVTPTRLPARARHRSHRMVRQSQVARKSSRRRLTSSGASSCIQCPGPSMRS